MKTFILLICLIHISTTLARIVRAHSDPTILLYEDTFDSPSQTAVYFTPVIHQLNDDGSESIQKYVEVKDLVVTQYDTSSSEEPVKSDNDNTKESQNNNDLKNHQTKSDNTKEDVLEEELIEFAQPKEKPITKSGSSVSERQTNEKGSQNGNDEVKAKLEKKETSSGKRYGTIEPGEKSDYINVMDFFSQKPFGHSEYWDSDEFLGDNKYDDEKDAYLKDVLFSRKYFNSDFGDELSSHGAGNSYETESDVPHHHFGLEFTDPKYYY